MNIILRRRLLGNTSTRAIANLSETGLQAVRNDQEIPDAEYLFRWGCTSNVEANHVVNKAEFIHKVSDKTAFRLDLDEEDLCPATWIDRDLVEFPCIVRPRMHHQGRNFHVCTTPADLITAIERCGPGWYASPIINKVSEYRVYVVQGRVVCVARKFPGSPDQLAWNVFQGGRFENTRWKEWPLKAVKASIKAAALSGLDFCGVDVIVDPEGSPFVLEINSAPSLTSPYRQKCFAKAFDWIVNHGLGNIPVVPEKRGYRKFIHPAICSQAVVS